MTVEKKQRKLLNATFIGQLGAGASEDHELGSVPDGKTWRILKLGASQFASGSNVSGRVQLKVGGAVVREIALSSTTYELNIETDIVGPADVVVVRENGPGQPREVTAWITGYEF